MNVKENLPLQYVHYPPLYGTFIGFSEHQLEEFYFCSCSKPSIDNYFSGHEKINSGSAFPIDILEDGGCVYKKRIIYKDKICHRCNMSTPTVQYCHKMYGSLFKQHHGWYINQTFLKYGINRFVLSLDNVDRKYCPDELWSALNETKIKMELRDQVLLEKSHSISMEVNDEVAYQFYIKLGKLDKEISKIRRRINNYIENECRIEFGYKKIGEGWLAESQLFNICKRIFPENKIERHLRPPWLNGLELDIYIPELNIGIEYQGQQHFFPIKAWGGKKSYQELKERDKLKKEMCKTNGIRLIEILFNEPLTEDYVRNKINTIF